MFSIVISMHIMTGLYISQIEAERHEKWSLG